LRSNGSDRWSLVVQTLHQAEKLWPQLLAARFVQKPHCFVARRAAGQPFQTILVASADFIGRKRGEFESWRRQARRGGLGRSFPLRRPSIRGLGSWRRGMCLSGIEFVELGARSLRMGAVRMSGKKQAPSCGRIYPLRNAIVQVLIDIRSRDWVDPGRVDFGVCRCEELLRMTLMSSSHGSLATFSRLRGE
jgi:hypothetical protein